MAARGLGDADRVIRRRSSCRGDARPVTRGDALRADLPTRADAEPVASWSIDPKQVVPVMDRAALHTVPDGLLRLQAGSHQLPEDGACLMEYVSVLAGTTFSDHPSCTDPTLAALSRLVNDASTDEGRLLLAAFAPALAASGGSSDARRTAAVVRATLRAARVAAGDTAFLHRHVIRAERRYHTVTGAGPLAALARHLDPVHRRGAARHRLEGAVAVLRVLPAARRDPALHAALAAAIAAALPADSAEHAQGDDLPTAGGPTGARTP